MPLAQTLEQAGGPCVTAGLLSCKAEFESRKKTDDMDGFEPLNWDAIEMLIVGGGECVTQSSKESWLPPDESVMFTDPSSLFCGVPENVKFENDNQEGSFEKTETVEFSEPKVTGEMDQE